MCSCIAAVLLVLCLCTTPYCDGGTTLAIYHFLNSFAFICRLVSGTSLVAVVSTALASSYTYVSHGAVDATAALVISCCAVLTAPLGANLTATLNATVSCSPEDQDCMCLMNILL
jgi:hypothetical protein